MARRLQRRLEIEAKRQIRYEMNNMIDEIFHPQGRWVEDFIAHYCVEKLTGLSDEQIIKKALYYYFLR